MVLREVLHLANYIVMPDDSQVTLTNLNSINNKKIELQNSERTQSGFKVVQTFNGNKKAISLGFAPTAALLVRNVENAIDSCPGYAFTVWLDYLNGSISGLISNFNSEKVLAGSDLFTYSFDIEEE